MSIEIALIQNMLTKVAANSSLNKKTALFEVKANKFIPGGSYLQIDDVGNVDAVQSIVSGALLQIPIANPALTNSYFTKFYAVGNNFFVKVFGSSTNSSVGIVFLYELKDGALSEVHSFNININQQFVLNNTATNGSVLFEQISDDTFAYCSNTDSDGGIVSFNIRFLKINTTLKKISSPNFAITTSAVSSASYSKANIKKLRDNVFMFVFYVNSTTYKYNVFNVSDDCSAATQSGEQRCDSAINGIIASGKNTVLFLSSSIPVMLSFDDDVTKAPIRFAAARTLTTADPLYNALTFNSNNRLSNAYSKTLRLNQSDDRVCYLFSIAQTSVLCRMLGNTDSLTVEISYYEEKNSNGFYVPGSYDIAVIDNDNLLFYGAAMGSYSDARHHYLARIELDHVNKTYEVKMLCKTPFLSSSDPLYQVSTALDLLVDKIVASRAINNTSSEIILLDSDFHRYATKVDAVAVDDIPANSIGLAFSSSEVIPMLTHAGGDDVLGHYKTTSTKFAVLKR